MATSEPLIASAPQPSARHYEDVVEAILEGDVVPFLGAGANLCGQPVSEWDPKKSKRLPLGSELARYLAKEFKYEPREFKATCACHTRNHKFLEVADDLLRISQYAELVKDPGLLYKRLSELFDRDYPPTPLHWLLANLPSKLAEKGRREPHLLVITTNYDDIMERTFRMTGEPFDVVYYMAVGPLRGKFIHLPWQGEVGTVGNNDPKLSLKKVSIVFKIHGAVFRSAGAGAEQVDELITAEEYSSSFVITEDNYIDYLTQVDLNTIPVALRVKMLQSNFLFLGYSLRDWNLRAFLHRIWHKRPVYRRSWAIQRAPEPLEAQFWRKRQVEIFDADLLDYTMMLCRRLSIPTLPTSAPAPRADSRSRPRRRKTV